MGASGAGKTSLMNAICDRIIKNKTSIITGDVKVNDSYKLTSKMFGSFSGYVMQDDVLFAYFTVKEALKFAARLRLKVPIKEQDERVKNLIL